MVEKVVPKIVLLVVYKTENNTWRGFCSPYAVTCEATSIKEAQKQIQELVEAYEDGLKKYDYPKHLSIKTLTNPMDKKVLSIVTKKIADDMARAMKKNLTRFQTETSSRFRIDDILGQYRPSGVTC